jgi:hypothetical protein
MPKTVRVRIAVVVGSNGKWVAGGPTDDPSIYKDFIDNNVDGRSVYPEYDATYWVTAELPVPDGIEVEGEVEDAR